MPGGEGVKIFREKLGPSQDELDELLEKAFTAVDGLWFLGVEEAVVDQEMFAPAATP